MGIKREEGMYFPIYEKTGIPDFCLNSKKKDRRIYSAGALKSVWT